MYGRVKTPAQKASPGKWLPVALHSHNLIKAFLCGPVTLSVLSAQVEESGRLDEVIDHRAAAFLASSCPEAPSGKQGVGRLAEYAQAPPPFAHVTQGFHFLPLG